MSSWRSCRFLLAPARPGWAGWKAYKAGSKPKPPPKPKPKVQATTTPRLGGIQKPVPVSPTLASFVGASEISRADVVKKIWEHIKLHNLQNPAKKTEIHCDAKLKSLFDGRDTVGFLEISKLLSPHFVKTD